jgi:ABC-type Fe3+-siderophore transport system permease subunit
MPDTTVLPMLFLVFGLVVIALIVAVLFKRGQGLGPTTVRMVGITIVLSIAAALTATGVQQEKLTAVIGLLGTVAGYLLGQTERKEPAA